MTTQGYKIEHCVEIETIVPLLKEWHKEQEGDELGINVRVESVIEDLENHLKALSGTIIIATKDEIVGFLAIFKVDSFVGIQNIGFEKYWYVKPGHNVGVRLFKEAHKWCKENECSMFVMCASNIASVIHDKVSRFYVRMGMKLFETTYIMEVK